LPEVAEMREREDHSEVVLGRVIRVRVLKVTSNGIVVGFGRRLSGYIPADEFAAGATAAPAQLYRVGETLLAMIVTICDRGRRFVLSLKDAGKSLPAATAEPSLSEAEESPQSAEPLSFERIYRRYQRDSQMRLSLLRKNIESKRGEFR
jgi:ribosomal protein S1